jgi:hypothetical protein
VAEREQADGNEDSSTLQAPTVQAWLDGWLS